MRNRLDKIGSALVKWRRAHQKTKPHHGATVWGFENWSVYVDRRFFGLLTSTTYREHHSADCIDPKLVQT